MFVGHVQGPCEIRRKEKSDPVHLDRVLALTGLLGEPGPELASFEALGERDPDAHVAGVETAGLERPPQDRDRARRHVESHAANATRTRR
jgi:hypothetical protein